MTRDALTHYFDDPGLRLSALLEGLFGRRRDAVSAALRHSAESGYPASTEGVRLLVAYAQGHISSRQYAVRILAALSWATSAAVPSAPVPSAQLRVEPMADLLPSSDWLEPRRALVAPPLASKKTRREEAVHAYMTGRIPVEEFLRLSRARTA